MTNILEKYLSQIQSFEFIFVDDGSTDNTLEVLQKLKNQDNRIHYISFSRNFGKEAAMLAGIEIIDSAGDFHLMTRPYVDGTMSLVVIIGIFLFHETITIRQMIGIILGAVAIILIVV